jgi:hypothetical protein
MTGRRTLKPTDGSSDEHISPDAATREVRVVDSLLANDVLLDRDDATRRQSYQQQTPSVPPVTYRNTYPTPAFLPPSPPPPAAMHAPMPAMHRAPSFSQPMSPVPPSVRPMPMPTHRSQERPSTARWTFALMAIILVALATGTFFFLR